MIRREGKAYIRLGRAQLELDETYPGLLNPRRTSAALDDRLVQDQAINHLTILNCPANFLDYSDITQVYVVRSLGIDHLQHRVDSHRTQQARVLRDNLRRKRGRGGLEEGSAIGQVNRTRHVVEDFDGGACGSLKRLGNHSRVNALS